MRRRFAHGHGPRVLAVEIVAVQVEHRHKRGDQVEVLHPRVAAFPARAVGGADEPGHARVVRMQAVAAFAEPALVHQLRAVVGGEHHDRVLEQTELLDRLQQVTNPAIHEGHEPQVERLAAVGLLGRERDLRSAVGLLVVDLRVDEVLHAGLRRAVHIGVVPWRVPQLVRGEAVHPEEERALPVVVHEPVPGSPEDLRALPVLLAPPVECVEQVLRDRRMHSRRCLALGHVGSQVNTLHRAAAPGVVLLPADELPTQEPASEVHGRLEHMIGVADQPRQVAAIVEHLGQRVLLMGDRVPAWPGGLKALVRHDLAPGEGAMPGEEAPPDLDGRQPLGVASVEHHAFRRELVNVRRLHAAQGLPRADAVGPQTVYADDDDVRFHNSRSGFPARLPPHWVLVGSTRMPFVASRLGGIRPRTLMPAGVSRRASPSHPLPSGTLALRSQGKPCAGERGGALPLLATVVSVVPDLLSFSVPLESPALGQVPHEASGKLGTVTFPLPAGAPRNPPSGNT